MIILCKMTLRGMQRLVASSQEQETLKLKPLKPRVYSRPNDHKQFEMGFQSRMEDFLGEFKRIHPKWPLGKALLIWQPKFEKSILLCLELVTRSL